MWRLWILTLEIKEEFSDSAPVSGFSGGAGLWYQTWGTRRDGENLHHATRSWHYSEDQTGLLRWTAKGSSVWRLGLETSWNSYRKQNQTNIFSSITVCKADVNVHAPAQIHVPDGRLVVRNGRSRGGIKAVIHGIVVASLQTRTSSEHDWKNKKYMP